MLVSFNYHDNPAYVAAVGIVNDFAIVGMIVRQGRGFVCVYDLPSIPKTSIKHPDLYSATLSFVASVDDWIEKCGLEAAQ